MDLLIECVPNTPIDSNSYVIYTITGNTCIIVDPGSEDCVTLIEYITDKDLIPEYILLTHEHFDHIWGVNKLKDLYNPAIICSTECAKCIVDRKKNLSVFYNQVGFETYPADIEIEAVGGVLMWNEIDIRFIFTPGHSNGSVCILIDNSLFTGDTIIRNTKTVIKLPGGNKIKLLESISTLNKIVSDKKVTVYSGHGESFQYSELESKLLY